LTQVKARAAEWCEQFIFLAPQEPTDREGVCSYGRANNAGQLEGWKR
jgi:hypothetical protein